MTGNTIFPLFPLDLVVFPGERRPLHIFEDRYKAMIAHCRASEAPGGVGHFGISLIQDAEVCRVGCSVEITEIVREYPDGRLDLLTLGRQRFRTLEIFRDQPYLRAAVEFFADDHEPVDKALARGAAALHQQLLELVGEAGADQEDRPDLPRSFHLAPNAGLELRQKQRLLEMTSENRRLEELVEHLDRFIPALRQRREREKVTKSNGRFREL